MAQTTNQLTNEQKEFIVKKLAAFYTPRDIAQQLAAKYVGLKCNENDILANDPRLAIVSPELFLLYRSERERILDDPAAAPFAEQKARLIALSRQAERYESNNQPAEARQVYRQIAEEMGVVGKASAPPKTPELPGFKEITVKRTVVKPDA
jgi:hypothetical protein